MSRPFRYTFIIALAAFATGLSALGGWRYARASAPVSGPIILVSVDSLRADRLPVYGYRNGVTPAMDALAKDGVVFERAYSHAPQTLPAHASLLTGRLPFETGVQDEGGPVADDDQETLAELLNDRGYATGAAISSFMLRRESGLAQGFDFFDDDLSAAPEEIAAGRWRSGDAAEAAAEAWLDKVGSSRAFFFLHIDEPETAHLPIERPAGRDPYDVEITHADEAIGRLLHYLRSHQIYDRSTIIVTADHGEGLGDHGESEHGLLVYDEALHVPLIVKQAAGEGAGRRIPGAVAHMDVVPTVLDLAKAPHPHGLRGRSLVPVLEQSMPMPRRTIYSESRLAEYRFDGSILRTLTDGEWRYISAPEEELYDLQRDPDQRTNLAAVNADETKRWRQELARFEALASVADHEATSGRTAAPRDLTDIVAAVEARRTAIELMTVRRWADAIPALQSAIRLDPHPQDLWRDIAAAYVRLGRDEQAVKAYDRLLALEPADGDARLQAAETLTRLKRFNEAAAYASAVRDNADLADLGTLARASLVEIALARGDVAGARNEAVGATDENDHSALPDYVEGRVRYRAGRFAEAVPFFESAFAQSDPARPIANLHFYRGQVLTELGNETEAEVELKAEIASFPYELKARAALAALLWKRGDEPGTTEAIAALTAMSPTPQAFRLAATLWDGFGQRSRAADAREELRGLTIPPGSAPTAARREGSSAEAFRPASAPPR